MALGTQNLSICLENQFLVLTIGSDNLFKGLDFLEKLHSYLRNGFKIF